MTTLKIAFWAAFRCAFPADYAAAWFLFHHRTALMVR